MPNYEIFAAAILEELNPQSEPERDLVRSITNDRWRLKQAREIEDGLFSADGFLKNSRLILSLSNQEQKIQRSLDLRLTRLTDLQNARAAAREAALQQAIERYNTCIKQNLPFNPAMDGFVFSTAEVARASHLQHRLWLARTLFRSGSPSEDSPR